MKMKVLGKNIRRTVLQHIWSVYGIKMKNRNKSKPSSKMSAAHSVKFWNSPGCFAALFYAGLWQRTMRSPARRALRHQMGASLRPQNQEDGVQTVKQTAGEPCCENDVVAEIGEHQRTMATFKLENVEDLYEIGEVLGSGHFGQVREVRERTTGQRWAGKFLKVRRGAGSWLGVERKNVEKEVEVLQSLQHPNIMALRDVFESKAEVVLIVELISGGELFDFIAEKESLSESEGIDFLKQILHGVSYMHSKNIGHFDLKPENIMLSARGEPLPDIKIIDFGMAHHFIQGEEYKSMGGTPQYIAPEVINYEPLGTATDMWSIGVITYILLSGLSPFQGNTDEETLRNIVDMIYEFDDHHFRRTSTMAKDFIQQLLVKDQIKRMTADESLLHPWIKPLTRTQVANRNHSSINMKNFKKFNAKRKWKMSYNMVFACNRLFRLQLLCKHSTLEDQELRQCESDQEDTETKPASLIRRRPSNSS